MMLKEKLPNFKVLTSISVLDIPYENDEQNERDLAELWNKQNSILVSNGFDLDKTYSIHFFDSHYTDNHVIETDILEAIEYLAIKDGVDVVKYENGNYGFVAYYNGHENGFEILNESEEN